MKRLEIKGRRWFQKSAGNTYCAATVLIDDEAPEDCQVSFAYGYGSHYLTLAAQKLDKAGLLPGWRAGQSLYSWCEQNNVKFVYSVQDVSRKRDFASLRE